MKVASSTICGSILETTDYSIFEVCEFNREVKKTKKLSASLKREGWVNAYPLHVRKNGKGKFKIIGGHHRFEEAQKLGLPVKYVVCTDTMDVCEIEDATNPWRMPDYLSAYIQIGDNDYIAIKDMSVQTGMGLSTCMSLLNGDLGVGFNGASNFRKGEFVIRARDYADKVASIVMLIKDHKKEWASSNASVNAIARIIKAGHADMTRFKKKINTFHQLLKKQATMQMYMDMFEDIYNRSERGSRVPLAFLTNETLRERQTSFGGSK